MKVKFVSKPIPYNCDLISVNYDKGGDGVYRLCEYAIKNGIMYTVFRDYVESIFNYEISRNAFQTYIKDEDFPENARDTSKYLTDIFKYDEEKRILTIEYIGRESFFTEGHKIDEDFTTTAQFYIQLNEFASKNLWFEWDTRIFIDDRGKDFTKTKLHKENNGGCFGIFILLPISSIIYHLFTI